MELLQSPLSSVDSPDNSGHDDRPEVTQPSKVSTLTGGRPGSGAEA